jgi:pimeloyl-ACP methyl ester carboxylesterase
MIPSASLVEVGGAGHFMIASHPAHVARLVSGALAGAERAGARTNP